MQDLIRKRPGVTSTRVGYTGGDTPDATYHNHGKHAEAIETIFDPEQLSYRDLLEFFFQIHDPTTKNRQGLRHGHGPGSVTLGGRRVPVRRPRVRAVDGSGELPVPAYELFTSTEVLGRMAMERMLAGLSTRRYPAGLEPVGEAVEQAASATSKSAVSRRFVAATESALKNLLAADLSTLDLVASWRGPGRSRSCSRPRWWTGTKHPLALVEGSTENATLVTELLVGLRERRSGRHRPDPGCVGPAGAGPTR
jgi:putative transposase